MSKILISFSLIILLFTGCHSGFNTDSNRNNIEYYIIRDADTNKIRIDPKTGDSIEFMIEVMIDFYCPYNIILIDTLNEIYYHKKQFQCFTGYPENNSLPFYGFLKKEYFEKCSSVFEMEQIIMTDSLLHNRRVYLISNKDTISDKKYFSLRNALQNDSIKVSTRLLTEEEEEIMKSILNNFDYCPEKIIWHKTLMVPDEEILTQFKSNNVP